MEFRMFQQLSLPTDASTLQLSWQDRVQWDYLPGGIATEPRIYEVQLRDPATDAILDTLYSFSTGTQDTNPTGDTGWQTHTADLSAYAGQDVQLYYYEFIPQNFTGPGQIEFDAISLVYEPIDDDFYSIDVVAGEDLWILTSIPAAGPGEFVNQLDLALELIAPDGSLAAFDTDGSISHTAAMTGTYTVRVTSENDSSGEYVLAVNPRPVVYADDLVLSDGTIYEDEFVTLDGLFLDANPFTTHSVVVDWGDGTSSSAIVDQAANTFSAIHQYLDDGLTPGGSPSEIYDITVTVTTDIGLLSSEPAFTSIEVLNHDPTISAFTSDAPLSNPAGIGDVVSFDASFFDDGTLDTHSAEIDWGEGDPAEPVAVIQGDGFGFVSTNHVYSEAGIYEVELKLTDDDTGEATETTTVAVSGASIRNRTLNLVGTDSTDHVNMLQLGGSLIVYANFFDGVDLRTFDVADFDLVSVYLLDGNDSALFSNTMTMPIFVDGGDGNDAITAGGGNAVILGGAGNDWLKGGTDRSILIGGMGTDQLTSEPGGDILIGGYTAYDSQKEALLQILDEWSSGRSFLERTTNILDGTGPILGGTGLALEQDVTVFDDEDVDAVFNANGQDWLEFAST